MSVAPDGQGSHPHLEAAAGEPAAQQTKRTGPAGTPAPAVAPVDPQVAALLGTLARIIRRQCMETPGTEAGRQP
jgi:hypothetical protein